DVARGAGQSESVNMADDAKNSGELLIDQLADAPLGADAARELLNHISTGVVKINRTGEITYLNARARRLLESNRFELLGSSLREFEPYTVWPDGRPCLYG